MSGDPDGHNEGSCDSRRQRGSSGNDADGGQDGIIQDGAGNGLNEREDRGGRSGEKEVAIAASRDAVSTDPVSIAAAASDGDGIFGTSPSGMELGTRERGTEGGQRLSSLLTNGRGEPVKMAPPEVMRRVASYLNPTPSGLSGDVRAADGAVSVFEVL